MPLPLRLSDEPLRPGDGVTPMWLAISPVPGWLPEASRSPVPKGLTSENSMVDEVPRRPRSAPPCRFESSVIKQAPPELLPTSSVKHVSICLINGCMMLQGTADEPLDLQYWTDCDRRKP